jgi:hypothetical protein
VVGKRAGDVWVSREHNISDAAETERAVRHGINRNDRVAGSLLGTRSFGDYHGKMSLFR